MSDSRALINLHFEIYGKKFDQELWINYSPDYDGLDDRVREWFADCYAKARHGYDTYREQQIAEDREKFDREQYERLSRKYGK